MTGVERLGNALVYGGLALAATGMVVGELDGGANRTPSKPTANDRFAHYAAAVGVGAAAGGWVGSVFGVLAGRSFGGSMVAGALAGSTLGAAIAVATQR